MNTLEVAHCFRTPHRYACYITIVFMHAILVPRSCSGGCPVLLLIVHACRSCELLTTFTYCSHTSELCCTTDSVSYKGWGALGFPIPRSASPLPPKLCWLYCILCITSPPQWHQVLSLLVLKAMTLYEILTEVHSMNSYCGCSKVFILTTVLDSLAATITVWIYIYKVHVMIAAGILWLESADQVL